MVRLSFQSKILLLVLISCAALGVPTGSIALYNYYQSNLRATQDYRTTLFSDFDVKAKGEVQTMVSTLQEISDRQQRGELTQEQARKLGADLVRRAKFGKDGYFWADTSDGTNVVYLGKEIEGKNRIGTKDAKGKYLIREVSW